jgi:hypothetical protein
MRSPATSRLARTPSSFSTRPGGTRPRDRRADQRHLAASAGSQPRAEPHREHLPVSATDSLQPRVRRLGCTSSWNNLLGEAHRIMSIATRTWARSVNVRDLYKRLRLRLDHYNVAWNPEQRCRMCCSPITPRARRTTSWSDCLYATPTPEQHGARPCRRAPGRQFL